MTYDNNFYDIIRAGCQSSAAVIAPLIYEHLKPETVIDVGCGEGWHGKAFQDLGCDVLGIDGDYVANRVIPFTPVDLSKPFTVGGRFDLAIPGQGGTGHCFPGDTVVSGPSATRHFSRRYEGQFVELSFASGQLLTATPNHPVLTSKGWVAAGLLNEGDDVIRCNDAEGITRLIPDDYQVPALIEDVATSLGISGGVITKTMPVAPEDFHGDGRGSKIAVVLADRHLRNRIHVSLSQPSRQKRLIGAGVGAALLTCDRPTAQDIKTPLITFDSIDQGIGDSLTGLRRSSLRGDTIHLGQGSHFDPRSSQSTSNGRPTHTEFFSQLLRRGSRLISLDQVSGVQFRNVVGHPVYNLSTRSGWYVASGVIVHNCNEQWPDYWAGLFEAEGFDVSGALRFAIWEDERVENWYRQNILVAVSSEVERTPTLVDLLTSPLAPPWHIVHPILYDARRHR